MQDFRLDNATLTPAYGRDYTSKKAALADLEAGKDFILNDLSSPWDGKPISVRDINGPVRIRFHRLTKVFIYKPV